jgi:hypothetical protein
MSEQEPELVSASEIASWAWCPESWRLDALGKEPSNKSALRKGQTFHEQMSFLDWLTAKAVSLGWALLAVALFLAVSAYLLGRLP